MQELFEKQKQKLVTLEQAKSIALQLKANGKKIGFTNGCFDCCHLGHIYSFMETKRLCNVLFVAVNSDASVQKNKGPSRPIQDEKTRTILLASMDFIDYVLLFDDKTALPIIKELRPDIIAKEGYTLDKWPEGRFVQSYGGKAIVLKRLKGYSTSDLIKKIKEKEWER